MGKEEGSVIGLIAAIGLLLAAVWLGSKKRCRKCGEENDGNATCCKKCGGAL